MGIIKDFVQDHVLGNEGEGIFAAYNVRELDIYQDKRAALASLEIFQQVVAYSKLAPSDAQVCRDDAQNCLERFKNAYLAVGQAYYEVAPSRRSGSLEEFVKRHLPDTSAIEEDVRFLNDLFINGREDNNEK